MNLINYLLGQIEMVACPTLGLFLIHEADGDQLVFKV